MPDACWVVTWEMRSLLQSEFPSRGVTLRSNSLVFEGNWSGFCCAGNPRPQGRTTACWEGARQRPTQPGMMSARVGNESNSRCETGEKCVRSVRSAAASSALSSLCEFREDKFQEIHQDRRLEELQRFKLICKVQLLTGAAIELLLRKYQCHTPSCLIKHRCDRDTDLANDASPAWINTVNVSSALRVCLCSRP